MSLSEMNKINLQTESYEIKGKKGERFFPFYELEFNEWVIYESDIPKYFVRLQDNSETDSHLTNWITDELKSGNDLRNLIIELGKNTGNNWDIFPSQKGMEIENSYQSEQIELEILNDINGIK